MTEFRKHVLLLIAVLGIAAAAFAGCVTDPEVAELPPPADSATTGVLVVNEGLWYHDDATLTRYDPETGMAAQNYFTVCNPGMRLGDLANSITVWGNRAYISVTTSQTIEVLALPSCRSLGRVVLPPGSDPRHVVIVDSALGYVSCLNSDEVLEFNPTTFATGGTLKAGPAPEGLAVAAGMLFVANSGYGSLRANEPDASTVMAYDIETGERRATISVPQNPRDLVTLGDRIYVMCGLGDEPGAVIEIDPNTLDTVARWTIGSTMEMAADARRGVLWIVSASDGLLRLDPTRANSEADVVLRAEAYSPLGFYSVGVDSADGTVCVGVTTGYTVPGEVLLLDSDGRVTGRFRAGLNPGAFGFY